MSRVVKSLNFETANARPLRRRTPRRKANNKMHSLILNGLELQIEDGIELSVEDNGKRIVIKAKTGTPVIEHHFHHYGNGYYPPPVYVPPVVVPWSPSYVPPFTCGDVTTGSASAGSIPVLATPWMTFSTQNIN